MEGISGDFKGLPFLTWRIVKHASSVFDGATTDAHGSLGEKPIYTIYTVSGDVIIRDFWGVVNATLTDAADAGRLEVGVAGNTAQIEAQLAAATAGETLLEDGDIYLHGVSSLGVAARFASATLAQTWYINDGADIIETTSGADITAGQIDYYCIWAPCEAGASLIGAGTLS